MITMAGLGRIAAAGGIIDPRGRDAGSLTVGKGWQGLISPGNECPQVEAVIDFKKPSGSGSGRLFWF